MTHAEAVEMINFLRCNCIPNGEDAWQGSCRATGALAHGQAASPQTLDLPALRKFLTGIWDEGEVTELDDSQFELASWSWAS